MTDPRVLGGRYELGEMLGHGGMAEVHRGRDIRLGRAVAIKLLRPELARDPSFQGRFRREAQSAAALNHPAVVAVYDTGEDGEDQTLVPYIVMEYVEGRTLREVLHEEGRLLPQRALEVTAEICRALDYSHRNGIVHRDVKPGNVMLTPAGNVKVMDFGIARALTASSVTMTQTAAVIGTAQYLSPEQARGEAVDARSDVYSTGCLLYELLTGRPPFVADSPVAVAYQHVREDPVPPSRLDPDIPATVDAIVLKAMAKNPANRYQTAEEMRADIERAIGGRPVQATPVLAAETTVLPAAATSVPLRPAGPRRGRRAAAYIALALLFIGIFAVVLLVAKALIPKNTGEVHAPNVIGSTLARAEAVLAAAGLKAGPIDYGYSTVKAGLVYNQSPLSPFNVTKGESIQLWVSKGIHFVVVPPLNGLTESDATAALINAGLKLGTVTPAHSTLSKGTVLSSTPASGASVAAGSPVNLTVADGEIRVPNVVGKDEATATAVLQALGFTVLVQSTSDPTQPDGVVVL
ncbi:MAG TPA: Stk1 family PASTA domain-containing Ser/Thr kinase, partial [Mycobacteriales bacterium]|nr:Stk1 family PASTA domain-containing Ser/Thr kinase [Mycobacteriales bacterium]